MWRYIVKRLFYFVPTLFIISVVAFFLSRLAPGDPIACGASGLDLDSFGIGFYSKNYQKLYEDEALKKGLDKPLFYFSIHSKSIPDTLYRILRKDDRSQAMGMIRTFGNWPLIQKYRNTIAKLGNAIGAVDPSINDNELVAVRIEFQNLTSSKNNDNISNSLHRIIEAKTPYQKSISVLSQMALDQYKAIQANSTVWKNWVPKFSWYGFNNQYHTWIRNVLRGDFGVSCSSGLPAGEEIKSALKWTLMLSIPAIFLAFLIAIPIGLFSGVRDGGRFDKWSGRILFMLYAMPSFWVGTLLLVFLTTSEYSPWLDWFPSVGLGSLPKTAPLWSRFWETTSHLILPIICMTYSSLAFLARQTKAGVVKTIKEAFVTTAKAKGLPNREVINRHVLKYSLFPLIAYVAVIIPGAISGAVIIESIFNIPGMGQKTITSIFERDWNVVYGILFLGAVLTLIGNLVADILYTWLDPRIEFGKQSKSVGDE